MSLYESGYFRTGKGTLRGRDYGSLSLVDRNLVFNGKKGRQDIIPLSEINSIKRSKNCVYLTLKSGVEWQFHIMAYWKAPSISEGFGNIKKAEAMEGLLKYLISNPNY